MWKKSKRNLGPTSAELQKVLNQYVKDSDAKTTSLRAKIRSLEVEIEKLNNICDQAKDLELIKTERILEAKQSRLKKIKTELHEFESSMERNLEYLKDDITRTQNYELKLDANAVLIESEKALKKYRMLKSVVEAIEADKDQ
ncbi:MAG: hypothetical protein SFY67_02600 [Candidatus Melainabacteria bacterium]|nr:hypothetical protein [Candidatus Melainabacteria bacterium]